MHNYWPFVHSTPQLTRANTRYLDASKQANKQTNKQTRAVNRQLQDDLPWVLALRVSFVEGIVNRTVVMYINAASFKNEIDRKIKGF